jgi:hypothetical protein
LGALLLVSNGQKFDEHLLQHISTTSHSQFASFEFCVENLFMSEDQLVSKRLKLDINNTYTNTRMNFLSAHQSSQKPFAETIAEFLERPSNFKPKPEHINMTLPDVRFLLSS